MDQIVNAEIAKVKVELKIKVFLSLTDYLLGSTQLQLIFMQVDSKRAHGRLLPQQLRRPCRRFTRDSLRC